MLRCLLDRSIVYHFLFLRSFGTLLLLALLLASSNVLADAITPQQLAQAEKRLVNILGQIERHETNEAFAAVKQLAEEIPNFRAAQLLYADMLRLRTGGIPIGEQLALSQTAPSVRNVGVADQNIAPPEFFSGLKAELQQRRQATLDLPPPGTIPSNFQHISPTVKHALAIDASRSRLYVFKNSAKGLELINHFYVTVGRKGIHKRYEGDQKTPVGIYFVGRQISPARLPDLYGQGALTVNYPNDWDRLLGRTGSGIWLHGVPSDQFSRVPQASDGCVVLSNPDINFLMSSIDPRTPVLITESINWVTPRSAQKPEQKDPFLQELLRWKNAWRQGDIATVERFYRGSNLNINKVRNRLTALGPLTKLAVNELSIYSWVEEVGEIRIVNLQVASDSRTNLRQYWLKHKGHWTIFSEDALA